MLDIEKLEATAKAATPGPWYTRPISDDDLYPRGLSIHAEGAKDPISDEDHAPSSKDANYIAAANPAVVLELIEMVRAPTRLATVADSQLRRFDFVDPAEGSATMDEQPDGWWVTYDEALAHAAQAVAAAEKRAGLKALNACDKACDEYRATIAVERTAKQHAIQQAQQHAMEARTQRGTVLDILRHFGCPEEDWNALTLIKSARADDLAAAVAAERERAARLALQWSNARHPDHGGNALRAYVQALRDGVQVCEDESRDYHWSKSPAAPAAPAGEWADAERICNLPAVHEVIQGFADDQTGDNATMVLREVMRALAQVTQDSGRDAALTAAVGNLIKAKGRFHSEQNYTAVVSAYNAAVAAQQGEKGAS